MPAVGPSNIHQIVTRAVAQHEGALTGYALSITGDLEAARDVVQDVFLKLFLQEEQGDLPRLAGPGMKAWLYTVCRHRALDWLRKHRRMVSLSEHAAEGLVCEATLPGHGEVWGDEGERLLQLLERLPPNQAECLRLKFQHDLSYQEICTATGLSLTNVGYLIHVGLKRLRQWAGGPATIAGVCVAPASASTY